MVDDERGPRLLMDTQNWNRDRFRPMSDLFPELASPEGVTGHQIGDDARLGLVPSAPSREFVLGGAAPSIAGVLNDYVGLMNDQKAYMDWAFREMTVKQIVTQAENSMPEGEPFIVYIHDPGTANEHVVIIPGQLDPQQPSFGELEQFGMPADNRVLPDVGRGPENQSPGSNFFYTDPKGKVHTAEVAGGPGGLPAQQARPFVQREPNGDVRPRDVLREGGPLPARGDLDPDHPSYHDPSGLA